jgi:hypothetical protein
MRDLWIHDDDLIVATHGRSFWILDDITPLREMSTEISNSIHLFKPAPAYRIERDTYSDTPMPPDEPVGENPPDGAIIDYSLSTAATKVTIEIFDAQSKLVRRFASDDKPEATQEQLEKQLIPLYWLRQPQQLSTAAGMHRWVWDLHYTAPASTRHEYPIAAIAHDTPRLPLGPNAVPGTYSVRLTVDGKSSTASLLVKMDPRIKMSSADLEKKFQAESQLAYMVSKSTDAILQATSIREQLKKLAAEASAKETVESLDKQLSALLGSPAGFLAPPTSEATLTRINGAAGTLYQQVWQVDAAPTSSQIAAFTTTQHESADVMKRWQQFLQSDLPAANRSLHDANIPEIKPDSEIEYDQSQGDEE